MDQNAVIDAIGVAAMVAICQAYRNPGGEAVHRFAGRWADRHEVGAREKLSGAVEVDAKANILQATTMGATETLTRLRERANFTRSPFAGSFEGGGNELAAAGRWHLFLTGCAKACAGRFFPATPLLRSCWRSLAARRMTWR